MAAGAGAVEGDPPRRSWRAQHAWVPLPPRAPRHAGRRHRACAITRASRKTVMGVRPVAVSSMTGFARVEGEIDGIGWAWELKSVNGKALDLRFRLPPGFDALEVPSKAILSEACKR